MADGKKQSQDQNSGSPDLTRRRLIKTAGWTIPAITVVKLPAHAATSPTTTTAPTCQSGSRSFTSPGRFTFDVPPDCSIEIEVLGAGGGGDNASGTGGAPHYSGGDGGKTSATWAPGVLYGQLQVFVGSGGQFNSSSSPGGGGSPGGGNTEGFSGGGGGFSGVFTTTNGYNDPLIVAGGGGGASPVVDGGDGGGNGTDGGPIGDGGRAGGNGGGRGGLPGGDYGTDGERWQGGTGSYNGGGGGGGYHGGGGGGGGYDYGGGGGGSGFIRADGTSPNQVNGAGAAGGFTQQQPQTKGGDGSVTITWG